MKYSARSGPRGATTLMAIIVIRAWPVAVYHSVLEAASLASRAVLEASEDPKILGVSKVRANKRD